MSGGAGNDTLSGHEASDSLYGGIGDDLLAGGSGADRLDGEAGSDTASYDTSTEAVIVDLSAGHAADGGVWGWLTQWYFAARAVGVGGDAEVDRFSSVENLIGSAFDDVLTGNHNGNRLDGGAGNDTLTGGAGADVSVFRGGADVVTDFNFGTRFFGIELWGADLIEVDVDGVDSFADLMTHAV